MKTALEQKEEDEKNKYCKVEKQIMMLLHPLVSPYDLSESNLRMHMYNNVHFVRAVRELSSVIFQQQKKIDPDLELRELTQFMMLQAKRDRFS